MPKQLNKDELKQLIRELVGPERAEIREESIAKGKESGALERKQVVELYQSRDRAEKKVSRCDVGEKELYELDSGEKKRMMGRAIQYMMRAKGNPELAIDVARRAGSVKLAEYWSKALGTSTLAGGGALVPPEFSDQVIEELGAKAVVLASGVTRMPMSNGNLTLPFIDDSATAAYKAESANATKSEPTFGQLELNSKELISLVPYSNRMIYAEGTKIESVLSNHLVRIMARKLDVTLIRAAGTSNEPQGMLYWADSGNKFDADATVNLDNVTSDLGKAVQNLEDNDVDLDGSPGWLFTPRTKKYLFTVRDGNGNLPFRDEMVGGSLMGYSWKTTTQIPNNLGGSSNESEVYFAAFDSLVFAEDENLEISTHDGAAYWDGSSVVSGVSRNETVMRAIAVHDFGAQHRGKEISVIEKVKWGV